MVILATDGPSGAFSLIYLPSLDQSKHGTYQMKAEHLTNKMVSFILLLLDDLPFFEFR